jgi:hypothetical protein
MRKMCDLDRITEYIKEHEGERRFLADWCEDLNRMTRKKLTRRQMAFVFNKVLPKEFSVERKEAPCSYAFVPLSS